MIIENDAEIIFAIQDIRFLGLANIENSVKKKKIYICYGQSRLGIRCIGENQLEFCPS